MDVRRACVKHKTSKKNLKRHRYRESIYWLCTESDTLKENGF